MVTYLPNLASGVPVGAWYNLSISQFISLVMLSLGSWLLAKNLREVAQKPRVDLRTLVDVAPTP
jgi:hypothetical protein